MAGQMTKEIALQMVLRIVVHMAVWMAVQMAAQVAARRAVRMAVQMSMQMAVQTVEQTASRMAARMAVQMVVQMDWLPGDPFAHASKKWVSRFPKCLKTPPNLVLGGCLVGVKVDGPLHVGVFFSLLLHLGASPKASRYPTVP